MVISTVDWDQLDKRKFYTIGPALNLCTRAFLYPTKLIKTRLQVQASGAGPKYTGMADALRKIIRAEGVRALYRGFLPDCVGLLASQLYITSFEVLRARSEPFIAHDFARNLMAGGVASLTSQTLMVPFEIVSQKLMVAPGTAGESVRGSGSGSRQPASKAATPTRLAREILRADGFAGFYKGYWASLLTFAPTSGIWWATYGAVRRRQLGSDGGGTFAPGTLAGLVADQASAGWCAGIIAAGVTNPIDVVRTRLQVLGRAGDKSTIRSTCKTILASDGISGFLHGAQARMLHSSSSATLLIVTYEFLKRTALKAEYR